MRPRRVCRPSTWSPVPLFYFTHEAGWSYLGHPKSGIDVPLLTPAGENPEQVDLAGLTISRALAKTITFRTIATVVDFTTNYVVVGNVAQAAILSATGFVLGPFVYYGHEKAWDYFGGQGEPARDAEPRLLPAPPSFLLAHDLLGKPPRTFPDHALEIQRRIVDHFLHHEERPRLAHAGKRGSAARHGCD